MGCVSSTFETVLWGHRACCRRPLQMNRQMSRGPTDGKQAAASLTTEFTCLKLVWLN